MESSSSLVQGQAPSSGVFHSLRDPHYRRLWTAAWFWYVARMMEMVVISWLVLQMTSSPFQVAMVGVARMAPMFLLGLISGTLADRFPKRRILVSVQVLNLTATAGMTALLVTGLIQAWHAFAISFLMGTAWAIDFSARRAYFTEFLGGERLINAISLDVAALTGSAMLGPLLGGVLIKLVSFQGAYGVMVGLYVVGLALLLSMASVAATPGPVVRAGVLTSLLAGLRAIRSNQALMTTLAVTVVLNFFGFPYLQMVPIIARDVLNVGSVGYGVLGAAAGLGAITGSLVIASRTVQHALRVYSLGATLMLASAFLFALSPNYLISFLLLFCAGVGLSGFATMQTAIVLRSTAPEMRGRALGAVALAIGASPLGLLVIGQMAEMADAQVALASLTGVGFLVMVLLRWRMRELRA